jgi:hypothetical protein
MKLPEMPELPKPTLTRRPDAYNYVDEVQHLFTADQMRSFFELGYKMGREDAAKVADERVEDCEESHASDGDERWLVYAKHARRLAAAIRRQGEQG